MGWNESVQDEMKWSRAGRNGWTMQHESRRYSTGRYHPSNCNFIANNWQFCYVYYISRNVTWVQVEEWTLDVFKWINHEWGLINLNQLWIRFDLLPLLWRPLLHGTDSSLLWSNWFAQYTSGSQIISSHSSVSYQKLRVCCFLHFLRPSKSVNKTIHWHLNRDCHVQHTYTILFYLYYVKISSSLWQKCVYKYYAPTHNKIRALQVINKCS